MLNSKNYWDYIKKSIFDKLFIIYKLFTLNISLNYKNKTIGNLRFFVKKFVLS
jgi:hypothetical protein